MKESSSTPDCKQHGHTRPSATQANQAFEGQGQAGTRGASDGDRCACAASRHRHVPSRALDVQPGQVGSVTRRALNLLDVHLLGHVDRRHELVERPVVLARSRLLDRVDERLGVEEPSDPRDLGCREVARPVVELQLPRQQVGDPAAERIAPVGTSHSGGGARTA
eukprot:5618846-Prymnesium_polylepis.3